jgi:cytochrome c553/cytochrome c5
MRLVRNALLLLAALGVLGFLGAASGVIPIKASSGHWAITGWFLDFSKRRSVATHTTRLKTPPLDDARLVLKGAGHYEVGCAACHGSPKLQTPRIAQAMTPPPPYLPPRINRWEPEELFYIVKHGIKFTGMPAWPAQQRDDEVWAVVAFLRALPELDEGEYRRLVGGEAGASGEAEPLGGLLAPDKIPRAVTESCARCHGADGLGRGEGAYPKLAGQRPDYLLASLQAFARGERHSGIMGPVTSGLSPDVMRELAGYYAGLPASPPSPSPEEVATVITLGEAIAQRGIPDRRVPSCVACHGQTATPRNPFYPELSGQYADYLILQLELFKSGNRGGTAYAHLMRPVAAHLTPEQMRAVATYYASLPPAPARPTR